MTIALAKGGNVLLSKEAPGLSKVLVGLGWKPRASVGAEFDLDASAVLVGASGQVALPGGIGCFVYYGSKVGVNHAVMLSEDNLTGEGEGDDEQISVQLTLLPPEVTKIIFPVSIYQAQQRRQNFGQVTGAYIRIVNQADGRELARYDLTEGASTETAMVFGEIYRNGAEWKFRAVGQGYASGLAGICAEHGLRLG